jgi:hypothetical protein
MPMEKTISLLTHMSKHADLQQHSNKNHLLIVLLNQA